MLQEQSCRGSLRHPEQHVMLKTKLIDQSSEVMCGSVSFCMRQQGRSVRRSHKGLQIGYFRHNKS